MNILGRYIVVLLFFVTSQSNLICEELTLFSASLHEGNQGHTGALGRVIDVKEAIRVTEIGAFESNQTAPYKIKVAIYNNSTKELVPGSKIYEINRENSSREKKYRFMKVESFVLPPGSYMLVAQGYYYDQQNGNTCYGGAGPGVKGVDCIAVGSSAWDEGGMIYPSRPDGNAYHAANIKFMKASDSVTLNNQPGSTMIRRRN